MPQVNIDIGAVANDGTGNRLRTAGIAMNANFSELYARVAEQAARSAGIETFTQAGADAVGRALHAKLQDAVHVRDFGADPAGAADATQAFNAAFATGKTVVADGGAYRLSGPVSFAAPRQWLLGRGGRVSLVGNFDAFVAGGNREGCGIEGLYVEAAGHTGGHVLRIDQAPRFAATDMVVWSAWNFAHVQRQNWAAFQNVWANNLRGAYGINWFGDNATGRSDILRLSGVVLAGSGGHKPDGIVMNGAVQTLQMQQVALVNVDRGLWVHNAAGAGLLPSFVMADDFEVDFPNRDAVRIEAGSHVHFGPALYLHGSSNGSGIYVAAGVAADTVSVSGGKITGHARHGVENLSRVRFGNAHMGGNALGDFLDPDRAVFQSPRVEVDPSFYLMRNGGNPLLNLDANDYVVYNRTLNALALTIGGAQAFSVSPAAFAAGVPIRFPGYTLAGLAALPAAANVGNTVRVTDRNHRLATSDGALWRWAGDGAVAS